MLTCARLPWFAVMEDYGVNNTAQLCQSLTYPFFTVTHFIVASLSSSYPTSIFSYKIFSLGLTVYGLLVFHLSFIFPLFTIFPIISKILSVANAVTAICKKMILCNIVKTIILTNYKHNNKPIFFLQIRLSL